MVGFNEENSMKIRWERPSHPRMFFWKNGEIVKNKLSILSWFELVWTKCPCFSLWEWLTMCDSPSWMVVLAAQPDCGKAVPLTNRIGTLQSGYVPLSRLRSFDSSISLCRFPHVWGFFFGTLIRFHPRHDLAVTVYFHVFSLYCEWHSFTVFKCSSPWLLQQWRFVS